MPTYYLMLTNGEKLPETEDLLSLFAKARALNEPHLNPVTAAIFRAGDPPVCLATFGVFKLNAKNGRLKRVQRAVPVDTEEEPEVGLADRPEDPEDAPDGGDL